MLKGVFCVFLAKGGDANRGGGENARGRGEAGAESDETASLRKRWFLAEK